MTLRYNLLLCFWSNWRSQSAKKEVGDESSQGIGPWKTWLKGGQRAVCASERKTGLSSWPAWLRISTRRTESSWNGFERLNSQQAAAWWVTPCGGEVPAWWAVRGRNISCSNCCFGFYVCKDRSMLHPPFYSHHIIMGLSLLRQAFEVAVLANEVKRVHELLRSIWVC